MRCGEYGPERMYDLCEAVITPHWTCEGYEHPHNRSEYSVVLGEGVSLPSFEAYVQLRTAYGRQWMQRALCDYLSTSPRSRIESLVGTWARSGSRVRKTASITCRSHTPCLSVASV